MTSSLFRVFRVFRVFAVFAAFAVFAVHAHAYRVSETAAEVIGRLSTRDDRILK